MKNIFLFKNNSSVYVAKQRLQDLLTTDRVSCTPELMEQMQQDLYATVSKYMEIQPETFDFKLTRSDIYIRFAGEK